MNPQKVVEGCFPDRELTESGCEREGAGSLL